MLAAEMSKEASCAYIESVSLELKGTLEHAAILGEAVDQLVQRHGSLRSTLSATGTRMMIWSSPARDDPHGRPERSIHPKRGRQALAALSEGGHDHGVRPDQRAPVPCTAHPAGC
jgi:hypothetical protein